MDALMFEILENNIGTVVLEGPFAAALLDVPQLKRKHIRIVLVEHNVEYKYFLESLKLPHWIAGLEARRIYSMEKKIVKCADHTICISPQDENDLQKEFDTTSISYLPSVLPKKEVLALKKEWDKLGDTIKNQFKKKLLERLENPHVPADRLSGFSGVFYKIKLRSVGYRLVYEVIEDKVIVYVLAVGKRERAEVYTAARDRLN